jgi:putative ABC transport system permease protein
LKAVSLQEETVGPVKAAILVLFGAVSCVLLIACANVATLLVTRNAGRQQQIAVRAALGASRGRLIRHFLTESLALGFLSGLLALCVAWWGVHMVRALGPPDIPRLNQVGLDARVFGFAFGVSLLTGAIFGLFPTLQATKPDLVACLKEAGVASQVGFGTSQRHRGQSLVLAVEVALSVVLMTGAGLMIRSFSRLLSVQLGFNPHHVLAVRLDETALRPLGQAGLTSLYQRTLEEVGALPGVESAALATTLPLDGLSIATAVALEGEAHGASGLDRTVQSEQVSPAYFSTMHIPILKGRGFSDHDTAGRSGVVIVNQSMARRFWPSESPVGKRIYVGGRGGAPCEIVGVVGDARDIRLERAPEPAFYYPYLQGGEAMSALVLRTTLDPAELSNAVVQRIRSVHNRASVLAAMTMEDLISRSVIGPRFHLALFGLFGFLGLVLASVGIYGVVAYSVSRRTREMGIRTALGADPSDVLAAVVGPTLLFVLGGAAVGLVAALALTRLVSGLLYGVGATDPLTFVAVAIVFAFVAGLASYIPARRVMNIDVAATLRYE